MLIGVMAVLAESFERIHRSNLIGMGVLPLQFEEGAGAESLGLDGTESFTVGSIDFSAGLPNPGKSGSSRDWAAKGPMLIGVMAVLAESFERIHRSNLIGMGVLPLQFEEGAGAESLGLDGTESFTVGSIDFSAGLPNPGKVDVIAKRADGSEVAFKAIVLPNPGKVDVIAKRADGSEVAFKAIVRVDTPTEGRYYANGGILHYVLRSLA